MIFLKDIKKDVIIPFSLGTILGSFLGGTFFVQIEPWLLQLIVAVLSYGLSLVKFQLLVLVT